MYFNYIQSRLSAPIYDVICTVPMYKVICTDPCTNETCTLPMYKVEVWCSNVSNP